MAKQRWEVQTDTLCDGWVNTWTDCDTGKPLTFTSRKEAKKELEEFMTDTVEAAALGDLAMAYNRDEFRIRKTGGSHANRVKKTSNPTHRRRTRASAQEIDCAIGARGRHRVQGREVPGVVHSATVQDIPASSFVECPGTPSSSKGEEVMIWQERPFIEFLNAVDDLLEVRHGITSNDTSLNMIAAAHEAGETPVEIVEQIAEKYDLQRIERGGAT